MSEHQRSHYNRAARIRARFAAEHAAQRQVVPPGWTRDSWRCYLDDPDGGRSPVRLPYPDLTPTAAEAASWEA